VAQARVAAAEHAASKAERQAMQRAEAAEAAAESKVAAAVAEADKVRSVWGQTLVCYRSLRPPSKKKP
jgi:hypothetical protein